MPRFHGLALAELYGALRQQVDYQRLPIAHGWPMCAPRRIDDPTRAVGGEQFAEFLGEHRIDPASFDASGDRSDQHGEFLGHHEIRSTAGNETDVHFRLAFYACQATYIIHSASLPAVRTPPSPMAH